MSLMRAIQSVLLAVALVALGSAPATADHHGEPGIGSFLNCSRPVDPPRCRAPYSAYVRGGLPTTCADCFANFPPN